MERAGTGDALTLPAGGGGGNSVNSVRGTYAAVHLGELCAPELCRAAAACGRGRRTRGSLGQAEREEKGGSPLELSKVMDGS